MIFSDPRILKTGLFNRQDLVFTPYQSPVGQLYLVSNGHALVGCYFESAWLSRSSDSKEGRDDVLDLVVSQLDEYFCKKRKEIELPIELSGTEFQKAVWKSLLQYNRLLSIM